MGFGIYAVGYVILLIGIGYIAHLMHIPDRWVIGVGLLLIGLGIMGAVQNGRLKDGN